MGISSWFGRIWMFLNVQNEMMLMLFMGFDVSDGFMIFMLAVIVYFDDRFEPNCDLLVR